MFFDENDLKINILSVLRLSFKESCAYAAARPFNALSYRVNGYADFSYNNMHTYVKKGDIIYVPKGFDYTINSHNDDLIVVHFEIEDNQQSSIISITPEDSAYLENKFLSLYEAWSKKQIGYEYQCKSDMYKILAKLHKQTHEQNIDSANDKMNEIIEYIHDKYTEQGFSVAELPKILGMSDTYFRKLFVSAFSKTPLKYINDLRVDYALELLSSGYYTVT